MTTVIAVLNRKGGVGKTTTALCFTECLQNTGKKILLIDLDQQHNATTQYQAQIENAATVYDLLAEREPLVNCIQHTTCGDIVAGDDWLAHAEGKLSGLAGSEFLLVEALQGAKDYDYVIIDCPPSLSLISTNALIAADEVIIPVLCDGYSVEAIQDVYQRVLAVTSNKRLNPALSVRGVLVCQYEAAHNVSKDALARLADFSRETGIPVFETKIRKSVKVREAQTRNKSLYKYAPKSTVAKDYELFTSEYLGGNHG